MDILKRNLVPGFLLLLVLTEGWVAWRQGRELDELRSRGLDHARLQGELAAASLQAAALQRRIVASDRRAGADTLGSKLLTPGSAAAGLSFDAAFRRSLENPKFRQSLAVAAKGTLDRFYGPLFRGLALPPKQLEQLKNLLVEAQLAKTDSIYAAADQGLAPGAGAEEHFEATTAAQKDSYDQIHAFLGDAGFDQFQQYQQTRFLHSALTSVQQSLSYTATPLSDDQANQLAKVLYQSIPAEQRPDATGYMAQVGAGLADPTALYLRQGFPAEGLAAAQGLVSAPQMQALVQLQQAEQAQKEIGRLRVAAHPSPAP